MLEILLVILAAGWALTGVISVIRIRDLRASNDLLAEAQSEASYRALDSENACGAAESEVQYLKLTLANVLNRPYNVVLTDQNIQQLGGLIQAMMKPGMEN